jgi:hypothetical protein
MFGQNGATINVPLLSNMYVCMYFNLLRAMYFENSLLWDHNIEHHASDYIFLLSIMHSFFVIGETFYVNNHVHPHFKCCNQNGDINQCYVCKFPRSQAHEIVE